MFSKFSLNIEKFKTTIKSVSLKLKTSISDKLLSIANSIEDITCSVNSILFFKTNSSIDLKSDGKVFD